MLKTIERARAAGGVLFAIVAACTAINAHATGFYIRAKGASGLGLAGAGDPARANDASTAFFNPAGMTLIDKPMAQGGFDVIAIDTKISSLGSSATTPGTGFVAAGYAGSDGRAREIIPVPNFYYTRPLSNDLWLGLAVAAPFGLGLEYSRDWFGRYDSIKSQLKTVDFAPSLAWRVNPAWSVGGGINVQYADATLTNALPDPLNPGGPTVATDGYAKLTGDSWALGYNAGVLYQPAAGTRLGLHYRSKIKHRIDAEATIANFSGGMAVFNGTSAAKTDLNLPAILSLGIAHELTPAWTLLAQAQWFGWSDFNEIRVRINGVPDNVRPQNFRDAHSVSLGAEYKANRAWTLRGGVRIDKTPTVDAFRNSAIPDSDVNWYGVGATYKTSERWRLDVGVLHAQYKKSSLNLNAAFYAGTGLDSTVNLRGQINNKVNVVSAALRYQF